MCTVTFLTGTDNSFILTSSRDEKTIRTRAEPPMVRDQFSFKLIYPKDPAGGGTWIAANNRSDVVCLLNGGFYPHLPGGKYRHSRGLVVLDFFSFGSAEEFRMNYDLSGIEPFTLVIIKNQRLIEFRWDGMNKFMSYPAMDAPHIWSSVTLYSPEVIRMREKWFQEWLDQHPVFDQESIIRFHHFGGTGQTDIAINMKRGDELKTVSITSIYSDGKVLEMKYQDLEDKNMHWISFPVEN